MLELGQTDSKIQDHLISDVDEASFMAEVIEASNLIPVIVDFWAPWCGPCKTLGPQLEAAVTGAKGAVKMAKVNVDETKELLVSCAFNPFQWSMHFGKVSRLMAFKAQYLHLKLLNLFNESSKRQVVRLIVG
jgi:thiol-disulfide isomerase/thioredoxin